MRPFCLLCIAVITVTMVTSEFDSDFCRKELDHIDDQSNIGGTKPLFYDNFYVFLEVKDPLSKTVSYTSEYYSQQSGMAYATYRTQVNQSQIWIDAKSDEIMTGPSDSSKICVDTVLDGSDLAIALGVTTDATGNVELNTPEVALGWHKKYINGSKYAGQDSTTARGIPTEHWVICAFDPQTQITTLTHWYIAEPADIFLPVVSKDDLSRHPPVLPVLAEVRGINRSDPKNITEFERRVDFTFFDKIQPDDPIFQIPTTMLCQAKPSEQVPLPKAPTFFTFRGEQITIYDPNSQTPQAPSLTFTIESYVQNLKFFVQDYIQPPSVNNVGNDKSYMRTVNDYNSGISFSMDLIFGSCFASTISSSSVDAISIAGGNVQMRTSTQFFDLDSDRYQYMGLHKMRGIDCDVWSAYFTDDQNDHQQNTLYTWYFASAQWLQAYGFNVSNAMPVSLEVQQDDQYTQFNFYEFNTQDEARIPDLSLCFDTNSTLNIQLNISATFDQIFNIGLVTFRRYFFATLTQHTSLKSTLRVSNLNIQPVSASQVSIQFKLFDFSQLHVTGDVVAAQVGLPNSQILKELNTSVNAGSFVIQVVDPNNQLNSTFAAVPQSMAVFTRNLFANGNGRGGPNRGRSSGYSGGAMAGIAFGMLALGIILGLVAIVGFRKFKAARNNPSVDLKRLDESES